MAKKKKQVTPMRMRRRQAQQQPMNPFGPLLFAALVGLAIFSLPAAGLAFVGLAPTLVLTMTAKGQFKAERLQCVAFMNIAGVIPFASQAMERSSDWIMILANPINLTAMWVAASIGYALIYVGPMVAAMILQSLSAERVKTLNQQRQALIELWGAELIGDKDSPEEEPSWAKGRRPGV